MQQRGLRLRSRAALHYLVYRPAAAAGGRRPPLLCFLHGYDEGAPTPLESGLTRHGPLAATATPSAEFIVVAPQLPRRGDLWHRYADTVQAIVDSEREACEADPRRVFLTGFSFGGNGVFDLALLQSGYWSALWPVDPTRVPREDPQSRVLLWFGDVARTHKQQFVETLGLVSVGENPDAERMYVDDGADHVGAARQAYSDMRAYAWLLKGRRAIP